MNDRTSSRSGMRVGDSEREEASSTLAEHYAQGRLTAAEHGERLDLVWAAKTHGELDPIFDDLPGASLRPVAAPSSRRRGFRGLPVPLLVILAVLVVVTVVTNLPVILFGLLAWCLVSGRYRGHSRR